MQVYKLYNDDNKRMLLTKSEVHVCYNEQMYTHSRVNIGNRNTRCVDLYILIATLFVTFVLIG